MHWWVCWVCRLLIMLLVVLHSCTCIELYRALPLQSSIRVGSRAFSANLLEDWCGGAVVIRRGHICFHWISLGRARLYVGGALPVFLNFPPLESSFGASSSRIDNRRLMVHRSSTQQCRVQATDYQARHAQSCQFLPSRCACQKWLAIVKKASALVMYCCA